ncbi:Sporulation and spore germination [compost metagenome]
MNRKIWVSGMLVLLLAISAGCGQKPQTAAPMPEQQNETTTVNGSGNQSTTTPEQNNSSNGSGNETSKGNNSNQPDEVNDKLSQSIDAYYTDDQMLDLIKETKEITYQQEQDKYLAALKSLQSNDSNLFPLWGKVEFHSAVLKDGALTIDITLPDEARLGAGGEVLALDALKKTMFQFQEVESIELLVDGQQVDTLMGHEELEHPMTRK